MIRWGPTHTCACEIGAHKVQLVPVVALAQPVHLNPVAPAHRLCVFSEMSQTQTLAFPVSCLFIMELTVAH
jgi:hypothetical protein